MKFDSFLLAHFNANSGASSPVTIRESDKDFGIYLDAYEQEVVNNYFGLETLHRGGKKLNPQAALKEFIRCSDGKKVSLNLIFPKLKKPKELRLYLSKKAGFKPSGDEQWFIYEDGKDIYVGSMLQSDWDFLVESKNEDTKLEPTVEDLLEEIFEEDEVPQNIGSDGQGYISSVKKKRAVEAQAVKRAIDYYSSKGYYPITDVGATCSYDLECQKGESILHVEVKGLTGSSPKVFLTYNEVVHAKKYSDVALFIVTDIFINEAYEASGGTDHIYDPWNIETGELLEQVYKYLPDVNGEITANF